MKHYQLIAFTVIVFLAGLNSSFVRAQEYKTKFVSVAFYNVENLYDTIDDPKTDDTEFTPAGPDKWTSARYHEKLAHLAKVISQIGDDQDKNGPAMIGLAEVENLQVVEDLIKTSPLDKKGFKIIHYDSPDKRGIDVAFLYQPKVFKYKESKTLTLKIPGNEDFYTRDILQVSGTLKGQPVFVLVNHWPSRSKGQKETQPLRNAAADLCLSAVQNIMKADPDAGIIVMGDLNDDPVDESLMDHLKIKTTAEGMGTNDLFDPMWQLFKDGKGTLEYKGIWNLFDQIIVSKTLICPSRGYCFVKAGVCKKDWMVEKGGKYDGYPFRSYAGSNYLGGYSDHLPVYIYLDKK